MPGVGRRDRADLPRRRLPRGRLRQHLRVARRRSRRSSPTRACRASRSPAPSAPARRSPRSPAATSRRSCSSSAAPTRSSCSRTDDLDATVETAVAARLDNNGQSCNAAKRFVVVDDLYEPFLEKFTAATDRVEAERPDVGGHRARPALVARGGRGPGRAGRSARSSRAPPWCAAARATAPSSRPTVLTDVTPGHPTPTTRSSSARSPQVFRVADEDEAVALANDTPFGLGSYVFTTDHEQALRVADQIEAGMVFVNVVARRRRRAALRRRQALRLGPRARPLRRRRVRQQEADPHRLILAERLARASGCPGTDRCTSAGPGHPSSARRPLSSPPRPARLAPPSRPARPAPPARRRHSVQPREWSRSAAIGAAEPAERDRSTRRPGVSPRGRRGLAHIPSRLGARLAPGVTSIGCRLPRSASRPCSSTATACSSTPRRSRTACCASMLHELGWPISADGVRRPLHRSRAQGRVRRDRGAHRHPARSSRGWLEFRARRRRPRWRSSLQPGRRRGRRRSRARGRGRRGTGSPAPRARTGQDRAAADEGRPGRGLR